MSTTGTAIVTGGSQGIGAGLVTRFLEKGYNVVGNSRAISDSTNLTPSPQLVLVDGDIGDSATAQKITDTAIARFGRILCPGQQCWFVGVQAFCGLHSW